MSKDKAFYLFTHTPTTHAVLWALIYACIVYYFYEKTKAGYDHPLARMNVAYGPHVVTTLWLAGIFFKQSNSMVVASKLGFINYWFRFHNGEFFVDRLAVAGELLAATVIFLLASYFIKRFLWDSTAGVIFPMLSMILFSISAWYFRSVALAGMEDGFIGGGQSGADCLIGILSYTAAVIAIVFGPAIEVGVEES